MDDAANDRGRIVAREDMPVVYRRPALTPKKDRGLSGPRHSTFEREDARAAEGKPRLTPASPTEEHRMYQG